MRVLGAPAAQVQRWVRRQTERLAAKRPTQGFLVHPDNIVAVKLLVAMQTQWRTEIASTFSRVFPVHLGLNYAVIETTARLEGLGEISTTDFRRLRILEAEVMSVWGQQRK